MQKSLKLKFRLPEYVNPRNAWRREIYKAALEAVKKQGVSYPEDAKLSVEVKLYLRGRALEIHDVDNRSEAKIGRSSDQLIPAQRYSRCLAGPDGRKQGGQEVCAYHSKRSAGFSRGHQQIIPSGTKPRAWACLSFADALIKVVLTLQ